MRTFPFIEREVSFMGIIRLPVTPFPARADVGVGRSLDGSGRPAGNLATPEAAVDAFMAALKADSDSAMVAIFGERAQGPDRPIPSRGN